LANSGAKQINSNHKNDASHEDLTSDLTVDGELRKFKISTSKKKLDNARRSRIQQMQTEKAAATLING